MTFKDDNDEKKRKLIASSIRERYPQRVPIICEPASDKLSIERVKFLAPENFKMGHFIFTVRKRIKNLRSTEAIYVFIGEKLAPTSKTLKEIYDENSDEDGLLYLTFDKENTFGHRMHL